MTLDLPTVTIPVRRGMLTRVRVEVPEDLETKVEQLINSTTDPDEFKAAVEKSNPFLREVKLTIIGTEPLP